MNDRSQRVVVGYDGSAEGVRAVEWAAAAAQSRQAPLTVVHAADYSAVLPGGLPGQPNPFEAAAMEVTKDGVERARKTAPELTVRAETHIARVAPALVEASADAALLVVGSRGRGEVTGALFGSVAFAVTTHARCPVVVVRSEADGMPGPDRPVVVGVDSWPASQPAVAFAAGLAAEAGAPLRVVSVYRAVFTESGSPSLYWALEAEGAVEFERLAQQKAVDAAEAAAAGARELYAGLDVTAQTLEGRVPRVLVRAAAGAGVLVVGARGGGGFAGLRLGSITHAVLHEAPCPVAVVPAVPEGGAGPEGT